MWNQGCYLNFEISFLSGSSISPMPRTNHPRLGFPNLRGYPASFPPRPGKWAALLEKPAQPNPGPTKPAVSEQTPTSSGHRVFLRHLLATRIKQMPENAEAERCSNSIVNPQSVTCPADAQPAGSPLGFSPVKPQEKLGRRNFPGCWDRPALWCY